MIAGKTFQALAMGKATIVGDNPANRELLTPGDHALFCPMGDPQALASAVLTLLGDAELRADLGGNGFRTFQERASSDVLSREVGRMVGELVGAPRT